MGGKCPFAEFDAYFSEVICRRIGKPAPRGAFSYITVT